MFHKPKTKTEYEIPAWMTDHIIDVLGGRNLVVELMTEANADGKPAGGVERWLLVQDMYGKVMLMEYLHREHMLTEGDEPTS